jgi:hypothetical protein
MSTNQTCLVVEAQIDGANFPDDSEITFKTPIAAPAVGHANDLRYEVVATIQDPDSRLKFVRVNAAASHRPFEGINFRRAPNGSRCTLEVDLIANTAKLYNLQEVALFDPCDAVQAPEGPTIIITPIDDPSRPIGQPGER